MKKYPLTLNYDRKKLLGYIVLTKEATTIIKKMTGIKKPFTLGYGGIIKDGKVDFNEFSILK